MALTEVVAGAFPFMGDCYSLEFNQNEGLVAREGGLVLVLRAVVWDSPPAVGSNARIEDVREQEVCLVAAGAPRPSEQRLGAYLKAVEDRIGRESRARLAAAAPAHWFDEYVLADETVVSVGQFDAALAPEARARRELIRWLSHPLEFGAPPASIELWDHRTLRWPPTDDERDLFLYRYEYPADGGRAQPRRGVGLVGSLTFSLYGEHAPSPDGTPEDALAMHCLFELNSQPAQTTNWSVAAGRKLLGL